MWSLKQETAGCWVLGGWLGGGWGVSTCPTAWSGWGRWAVLLAGGGTAPQEAGVRASGILFLAPAALRSLFSLAAGSFELIMMRECKCQRDPSFNLS